MWLISLWFYSNVLQLFFVRFPGAILLFENSTKRYFNCLIFLFNPNKRLCKTIAYKYTSCKILLYSVYFVYKIFFAIFLTMSFIDILFFFSHFVKAQMKLSHSLRLLSFEK